jgi:dipeptidyl aminopeptidase/acylaminoacyl peptidase
LLAGYGVLDGVVLPVQRGGKASNAGDLRQLVGSAEAAVAKLVALGVADPKRIAVGGQSRTAFLIADLLAHSDLFRAGIVRSGATDGTFTPVGVEDEGQSYAKLTAPLLLIHGMADDSSGTFLNELERLYSVLKDQGAKARLVLIPGEPHGYAARESVWEVLFEMVAWLERYLGR